MNNETKKTVLVVSIIVAVIVLGFTLACINNNFGYFGSSIILSLVIVMSLSGDSDN